jgi:hypothetical protein
MDISYDKKNNTPDVIFIIPYREREAQLNCFINHMTYILQDVTFTYEIIICHQKDKRPFNRGAIKNLGFLYVKNKYPQTYKNITLVFNDVDTMPGKKNMFNYLCNKGYVKHFYGFQYTLGGIVSICGEDFERIKGFPNYWGWGYEDNILYNRCVNNNLILDRSTFYKYNHLDVLQFFNGYERQSNVEVYNKFFSLKTKKLQYNDDKNNFETIINIQYNSEIIDNSKSNLISYTIVNFTSWDIPEKDEETKYDNISKLKQKHKNNNNFGLLFQ